MPAEFCERLARRPLQLTFDGFIIGPAEGGLEPPDSDEHRPPEATSSTIFHRGCRAVEVQLRRWPDRLRLELHSDHESRVGTRFEIDLRSRPFLSLRVRKGGAWSSLDYVRAINDWPRRNSSATRLFEAAETWHRQIEQVQLMEDAGRMVGQALVGADGKTLPLPEPPCPGWRSGDDHIVPLHTAEGVLAEGAHMHNCVASHIPQVLANAAALYHGEVAGKPLTIQIAPAISGYRVVEAKTFANDEPTAAQMRVLREFIAHFRGGLIAGGARCECKARTSLGEADHTTPP